MDTLHPTFPMRKMEGRSRRIFRRIVTGLSFLLAGMEVRAQPTPQPLAFVTVRALQVSTESAFQVYVWGDGKAERLRVSPVQPSPPVRARYANPLPLYADPPDPEAEPPPRPLAYVQLPEGIRDILLLGTVEGEERRFLAMEDDLLSADDRDWKLLNITPYPIAFQVGEGTPPVLIASHSQMKYRLPAEVPGGQAVMAAARIQGEAKKLYSSYWPLHENQRSLVLFVPQGNSVRLRRIQDFLPQREEEDDPR